MLNFAPSELQTYSYGTWEQNQEIQVISRTLFRGKVAGLFFSSVYTSPFFFFNMAIPDLFFFVLILR